MKKRYSPSPLSFWALTLLAVGPLSAQPAKPPVQSRPPSTGKPPAAGEAVAGWKLSGEELLVEISSQRKDLPSGIYAIKPPQAGSLSKGSTPKPILIAVGGQRPNWSPRHKMFTFLAGGRIWLGNPAGVSGPIAPALPESISAPAEPPMRWGQGGFGYAISRSPGWGSKVTIGGVHEDYPVEMVRPSALWSGRFPIDVLPLNSPAPEVAKISWPNILTTNEATFSPDGRRMAAEVYPAGPHDVNRNQSQIRIFQYQPWSGPNRKQKYNPTLNEPELRESEAAFYCVSTIPAFLPKSNQLFPGASKDAQFSPRWSPDGKWIAFSQYSASEQTFTPYVIEVDAPGSRPMSLSIGPANDPQNMPTSAAWGRQSAEVLGWASNNRVWMVDGSRSQLRSATLRGDQWKVTVEASVVGTGFGIDQIAFRDDVGVYTVDSDSPKGRLNFVNAKNGQQSVIDLPEGLTVKSITW